MSPVVKQPTASDIQVHDLLVQDQPDQHPTDCWVCKARNANPEAPAVADTATPTVEEQLAALRSQVEQLTSDIAARDSKIGDLEAQLAGKDAEGRIADLESKVAELTTRAEQAEGAAAAATQAHDQYVADLEAMAEKAATDAAEAAALTARREDRKAKVLDLGYKEATEAEPKGLVTDEKVDAWAALPDEAWDTVYAGLADAAATAGLKRSDDPVDDPNKVRIGDAKTPPAPAMDQATPPAADAAGDSSKALRNILGQRDVVAKLG